MSLFYTPGQLRNAVAISPATYRHWKEVLGPLGRQKGHSPCFSAGDLIAVAVVRVLSIDFAIRIGALGPVGDSIFALCNSAPWPTLERGWLIVDIPSAIVRFRPEVSETPADGAAIIVPLRPIAARLREQLLTAGEPEDQAMFRFPPTPLVSADKSSSARTRL